MICSISDCAVGYGTPQIPTFAKALGEYFGDEQVVIFEPDNALRPRSHERMTAYPGVMVERVPTPLEFYTAGGRDDYCRSVAAAINAAKPDVVVLTNIFVGKALLYLDYRPSLVIFQSLELITAYWPHDVEVARTLLHGGYIDLVIFPEANRQEIDYKALDYPNVPWRIMLNSCNAPTSADAVAPVGERVDRIVFTGNFGDATLFHWLQHPVMREIPIDLYGWFTDPRLAGEVPPNMRYLGALLPGQLREVRSRYAYSLVLWNPNAVNQRFACPNKFFESVASGVPVISTPHPQVVEFCDRYECGLPLPAWSPDVMEATCHLALEYYRNGKAYQQMVDGCQRAVREELNFDAQFRGVKEWLDGR